MSKRPFESDDNPGGSSPEFHEAKKGNGKERIRVARACDRCKRKKTKCDGQKPCVACKKLFLDCVYSQTPVSATPPVTTAQQPSYYARSVSRLDGINNPGLTNNGLKRYLSGLVPNQSVVGVSGASDDTPVMMRILQRLDSLENSIKYDANGSVNAGGNAGNGARSGSGSGPGPGPNGNTQNGPESGGAPLAGIPPGSVINSADLAYELAHYMEEQRVKETLGNYSFNLHKMRYTKRYISILPSVLGSTIYRTLSDESQKKVIVPRVQGYGWNMSGRHYLPLQAIEIPPQDLISESLSRSLLQYFFDKINPLHSTLHRPMFLQQFESYIKTEEKKDCLLFMGMFFVVCAISMRYSEIEEHREYPPGLEEQLFEHGHYIIQTFTFQWESVELVQGWLLITCYLRTCHRQSSTWVAMGNAIRLCQGMGLMKKFWSPSIPTYELLKITRVFWSCYTWDRFLALDFGRAFTIRDEEIQLDRPNYYKDDGWFSETSYVYLQLAFSISPLVQDFFRGGLSVNGANAIYDTLLDWNNNIAKPVGYGSDIEYANQLQTVDPAIICQIRLQYHDCILYLYTRGVYSLLDTSLGDGIPNEWPIVANSCKGIIDATEQLDKVGRLCTCWWLRLSSLYSAMLLLLVCINAGFETQEMMVYLSRGFALFDKLASDERFGMSQECRWSLRMLSSMICLRFQECQSTLQSIGINPGYSDVNERHFASMGLFSKEGRIIPPHQTSTNSTSSTPITTSPSDRFHQSNSQQHQQQQHQQQPLQMPPMSANIPNFSQPPPPPPPPPDQQLPPESSDQLLFASSLDWFSNWKWDAESSVASFLDNM